MIDHMRSGALYHGSQMQGLKILEPNEAGYGRRYVYATDTLAAAVIFLGRKRNSMQATWKTDGKSPFFCERRDGVFDEWYSGVGGSIYVLSKSDFQRDEHMDQHEFVSPGPVKVIEEIKVADAKAFLTDLEKQGKMRIILYKDRKTMFPNDNDLVEMCLDGLKKYSMEVTLERIRKLQPRIEKGFLERIRRQGQER